VHSIHHWHLEYPKLTLLIIISDTQANPRLHGLQCESQTVTGGLQGSEQVAGPPNYWRKFGEEDGTIEEPVTQGTFRNYVFDWILASACSMLTDGALSNLSSGGLIVSFWFLLA